MTIEQLRYFAELAYTRSFSRAAENLYIAQPALSKAIASMEKELGFKLFERTTHSVRLTPAGEQLYSAGENSLIPFIRDFDSIRSELRAGRRNYRIGIAYNESIPARLLDYLRHINLSSSPVHYLVTQDNHFNLSEKLGTDYDMVISSDRNIRDAAMLKWIPIQKFEMVMAVSKYHPLANRPDLAPIDFKDEMVFFSIPSGTASSDRIAKHIFHQLGGSINIKLMNTPVDSLHNVSLCCGAAIVPSTVRFNDYPDLLFFEFEKRDPLPEQCLVWQEERKEPEMLNFISDMYSMFPEPDPATPIPIR